MPLDPIGSDRASPLTAAAQQILETMRKPWEVK